MDSSTKIVVELLGKGIQQAEICRMFEVSPSAVSQINTKYAEQIAAAGADRALGQAGIDARLDALEGTVLGRLESALGYETDVSKLMGAYKILNGAHRRGRGETPSSINSPTAELHLHTNFIQQNIEFKQNTTGEIIEVDGIALTTAHSDMVHDLAGIGKEEAPEDAIAESDRAALTELFGEQ